ncbi:MAG TPA: hypothetical protein VFD43_06045 [Planctomycetota bacterium]|nr:hypothetical protein [Planctomycetota bacterium]
MRLAAVVAVVLAACGTPSSSRPAELASVPALSLAPAVVGYPIEDVALDVDGGLLLPAPGGGAPIAVPRMPAALGSRLFVGPALDPRTPWESRPGLGSHLWERQLSPAPVRPGIELYRTSRFKLMLGTRTLIDDRYADPVTTDPRHEPPDFETAAVVGLRLGF